MQTLRHLVLLCACAALSAAGTVCAGDDAFVERREIDREFPVDAGVVHTVVIDNVFGPIRVIGHDAPRVELHVEETVRARSQAAFDRAKREIRLEIGRDGDEVTAIVDGEFRRSRNHGWQWNGYQVEYAFTVRVPRRSHLILETVNDGTIEVEDVHGDFQVGNVNGPIALDGVTGPGSARTVNGGVHVRFDANPDGSCEFETVNGDVEMQFQPDLSADLFLKTFNGDALTDFDVVPLPSTPPQTELRDGRRVIRAGRWSGVRVGDGGSALRFATLNGDILIRNARR